MTSPEAAAGRRRYELRLSPIADPRVRRQVVRWLAQRFPFQELPVLDRALSGAGFLTRLELDAAEVPALLRELSAAGAPPAAVFLLPADLVARHSRDEEDATRQFAVFAERGGGFVPTWNWWACFLGPFWYLRKGMWAKGLVILVLTAYPFWPLPVTLLISLVLFVYCGVAGNWDYYLLRVKRTQWW